MGTIYISTKILLVDFQAIEILFFRFVIGFIALMIIYPKRLKGTSIKQECMFALAGLFFSQSKIELKFISKYRAILKAKIIDGLY